MNLLKKHDAFKNNIFIWKLALSRLIESPKVEHRKSVEFSTETKISKSCKSSTNLKWTQVNTTNSSTKLIKRISQFWLGSGHDISSVKS